VRTSRPAYRVYPANGGYTGGLITTASPGRVSTRSASTIPSITSVTRRIRPTAGRHPHRSSAKSANASWYALPRG